MDSDKRKPKVLITGANGQVGWELQHRSEMNDWNVCTVTREQLDISDIHAVNELIDTVKPEIIINAAAYTAVDKAESEKELAYQVNANGAGNLANAAQRTGARLIHISTDFVFDGEKCQPYKPDDLPNPLSVYGASKLAGEEQVLDATQGQAVIVRTSWVYSAHGNNFVKTMLRLMAERDELSVVADQIGTPTWANGLAQAIWSACDKRVDSGIYHWSDAGVASWYDFAFAIMEEGVAAGLLSRAVRIHPITTSDYPTPAKRPSFSVLDKSRAWECTGVKPEHWREALRMMLHSLK